MTRLTLPLLLTLTLVLVYVLLKLTGQDWLGVTGFKYLLTVLLASLGVLLVRAISFLLLDVVFKRRKGREAPALLRVPISIVIYSAIFVAIYSIVWQRDLSGILATSAVLTVILGLALQDTLGNFFAGLSLHVEQPYFIGDAIRLGDVIGRVEAVSWRTTAVRTNNNTLIIFPNSRVARDPLEVYRLNTLNRRVLTFPAPFSVPPERVIAIVQEIVARTPDVASERTPTVRINAFSDSSITYEALYWVKDYMLVPNIDARIRERVWYAYNRSDIDIPFPTRTLHISRGHGGDGLRKADWERALQSVELFEPLSAEEREQVVGSLVTYVYAPGEAIIRRGEAGESMFVISRGHVEVRLSSGDGAAQQVAALERGDFFGEMALFTGEPRTADVSALDEVEVLEIRKSALQPILAANEKLAEAFSRKIAERQARLSEYTRAAVHGDPKEESHTILRRIKRFFSLH